MKKAIAVCLSVIILTLGCLPIANAEDAIPDGYVGVYSIEDLFAIRYEPDKNYILMVDIDMTEETASGGSWDCGFGWRPICESEDVPFSGVFDGNGHSIIGINISGFVSEYVGLFGCVTGEIKSLSLKKAKITVSEINKKESSYYVGILAGFINGGSVSNVLVEGSISVNGIVDSSSYLLIGCGGIAGQCKDGKIEHCANVADVTSGGGASVYAGGICGFLKGTSAVISNCYNKGVISNGRFRYPPYVGGICGGLYESSVSHCINVGKVDGVGRCSAIAYVEQSGTIEYNYYLFGTSNSGCYSCDDSESTAIVVSEAQLVVQKVFGYLDFESVWFIDTSSGINNPQLQHNPEAGERTIVYPHYHSFDSSIIEPTCLTGGYTKFTCSLCSYQRIDEYTDPAGHTWDEGTITEEPTCTEAGTRTYHCTKDETHTKTEVEPAKGHAWDDGVIIEEPTCTADGLLVLTCLNDSAHTQSHVITRLGHEYKTTIVEPTCTEKGYTASICIRCGNSLTTDFTDALEHEWDNGKITKQASCKEEGVFTYTCLRDVSHTKTEPIPIIAHSFGAWSTTKTSTEYEEGIEERACSVCGEKESRSTAKLPRTELKLNKTSLDLIYKESETLTASEAVKWTSSNEKVVKIDANGKVTTVGKGTATITANSVQGGKTATCEVTVKYTFAQMLIRILLFGFIWY